MRSITIGCDHPSGCKALLHYDGTAGALEGWLARDVVDSTKRTMLHGVQDFTSRVTLYLCPEHAELGADLKSLPTHPEVVEFLHQEQPTADETKGIESWQKTSP